MTFEQKRDLNYFTNNFETTFSVPLVIVTKYKPFVMVLTGIEIASVLFSVARTAIFFPIKSVIEIDSIAFEVEEIVTKSCAGLGNIVIPELFNSDPIEVTSYKGITVPSAKTAIKVKASPPWLAAGFKNPEAKTTVL